MQKLIRGLHEFQDQVFGPRREFFERLAEGQSPDALFITCSDSRINPNLITQTQPGDLFIIRNAGNIVPPYKAAASGEAATIEYAIDVLNVRDVIVCGHSHCGAMQAILDPEATAHLPAVHRWLSFADSTRRIVRDNYGHLAGQTLLTAAVEENVLIQLEHLRTHPAVAAGLVRGALRLHAWVYKIESGEVFSFSPERGQFAPLRDGAAMATAAPRRPVGATI